MADRMGQVDVGIQPFLDAQLASDARCALHTVRRAATMDTLCAIASAIALAVLRHQPRTDPPEHPNPRDETHLTAL